MTNTVAQRTVAPAPVPTHGPDDTAGAVVVLSALAGLLAVTAVGFWVGLTRPGSVLLAAAAVVAALGAAVSAVVAITYFRRPEPSRHL